MEKPLADEALGAYENAGLILKEIKVKLQQGVKSGTGYLELARFVENEIFSMGGTPAFPCNISVNAIASHYTPQENDPLKLKTGDLVKIDLGVILNGYIADSAITLEVETSAYKDLIYATGQTLANAIAMIRPGIQTGEIGRVIEASAHLYGYNVLKGLYGHNLARDCLHGGLTIPSYDDGSRKKIREGDVLAIEPFLTPGSGGILRNKGGNIFQLIRPGYLCADDREKKILLYIERNYNSFPFARRWLDDQDALESLARRALVMEYPMLVEKDGAPVAQAEHTIIVGREGCRIIT